METKKRKMLQVRYADQDEAVITRLKIMALERHTSVSAIVMNLIRDYVKRAGQSGVQTMNQAVNQTQGGAK